MKWFPEKGFWKENDGKQFPRVWTRIFFTMLTFSEGVVYKMTSIAYSFMNNKNAGYGNNDHCEPTFRRSTETFAGSRSRSVSVNDVTSRGGTYPKRKRSKNRRKCLTVSINMKLIINKYKV